MEEEVMTNQQMKTILKMVDQIIRTSDSIECASARIQDLLNDYD